MSDTPHTSLDLIIIGGGPAGYVGAIRAAQLGLKVACVERAELGGVCLNWGCIPTKALLAQAEFYHRLMHEAADWGISVDTVKVDWSKVIGRSRNVAGNLNKGVIALFKKNKIQHIVGHAQITAPGQVAVHDKPGHVAQTLSAKNILIATGAQPRELPGVPFDREKIITSREAMTLTEQPKKLVIIGSGPIGMEFAYFYRAYGTEVTVIEMLDQVLPNEDADSSAAVARAFRRMGIDCKTGMKTTGIKTTDTGVEVSIESAADGKTKEIIAADKALVAIGVRGRYDGLFSEDMLKKVDFFKDHIKVSKVNYSTSVPGIYAVGDVIGPPWLAHVASEEAILCVERIAGQHGHPIDYDAIPGCTYCQPQVASLGKTEQALQASGLEADKDYKVGKFPFSASGKAQAIGSTAGFVKILSDAKTGEILGVHMVGEAVTELLAEMGLAKRLEATVEEVIATMHAHPTLSEAVHEAALGVDGRMIHF
jgi:dihydrolipoamide dehydrogenase